MEDTVVLLDFWASFYAMRVRVALEEKGIKYELNEENLLEKIRSPFLVELNPVHKEVPVLIHKDKPISESLVIVQYIDEMWPDKSPLLPSDPYERSQARFWADFVDKKIQTKSIWMTRGEEQEKAKKVFIESLKILEGELGDKPFFDGDKLGLVDIALVPIYSWYYTIENCANFRLDAERPKIAAWTKRCSEKESVARALPNPEIVYKFGLPLMQGFGLE